MIKIGSEEQFARLRHTLESAGYTEAAICSRLGIDKLGDFELETDRTQVQQWDADAAGVLTFLFMEGQYVDVRTASRWLGEAALATLRELGVVAENPANADEIAATVALYQTAGIYIASDRWNAPDRSKFRPQPDVVYPAVVSNAQRFLRLMPGRACRRMLDLGTGTGIAALTAARNFASEAVGVDIADRSAMFAEWNRRLNGIVNARVLVGDLYEPVAGEAFDLIVAHPPYVPVLRPKWIYHDGGSDGEQIIRRVIAGLPRHLDPGGLFYMLAMVSDRRDSRFEERVREWLGADSARFDVMLFPFNSLDPEDFAARAANASENAQADFGALRQAMRDFGVEEMLYAALLIQSRAEDRPVFTFRRQGTAATAISDMLAVLDFETSIQSPTGLESLLSARLKANRATELRVRHTLVDEGWAVEEYMLRSGAPFSMEARTDPWAPFLLALADGSRSTADYLAELKNQGAVPEDVPPHDFARAVGSLVSGGFLFMESETK